MFFDRISRVIAAGLFVASVWASVGITVARAQQTQSPDIRAFIADPGQLLRQYPNGGRLSIVVQQVALADPASFKALMGLLANANDIQKGALGEGLAQAAKILVLTDQPLAAEWQQQIAAVTDPTFKTAAINAFGDVQLGAVGGGPLAPPAAVGGRREAEGMDRRLRMRRLQSLRHLSRSRPEPLQEAPLILRVISQVIHQVIHQAVRQVLRHLILQVARSANKWFTRSEAAWALSNIG